MAGQEEQDKPGNRVTFRVKDYATSCHLQALFTATDKAKVSDVKHMMAIVLNKDVYRMYLFYRGSPMSDGSSLADHNIRNGSIVSLHYLRQGARPGIYFLGGGSPGNYRIYVDCIHKRFQGKEIEMHPEPDICDLQENMHAVWTVKYEEEDSAKGRNLLKALRSNSECSELFWEPATYYDIEAIQSGEDMKALQETPEASTPRLQRNDAVVLAFEELIPYLDDALSHLGLPPKIAMECIGYWLPRFLRIRDRGSHIAFRFAQDSEEYVSEVEICVDHSDEIIFVPHMFLVFGGVNPEADYDGTRAMAEARKIDWVQRLDFDIRKLQGGTNARFTVWGGVEVPAAEMKYLYGWDL